MTSIDFTIRTGTKNDVKVILEMIKELAEYEKEPNAVKTTEEDLIRDGFETQQPLFYTLIAELKDKTPVGFALYFWNYSTWEGRVLYLEDLYVKPNFRGKGIGLSLLKELAQIAKKYQCARFQWQVLDWNEPSIKFYKSIGAKKLEGWEIFRMDKNAIDKFLNSFYIFWDYCINFI